VGGKSPTDWIKCLECEQVRQYHHAD